MSGGSQHRKRWLYASLALLAALSLGFVLFVLRRYREIDERTRTWVIEELNRRFASQVNLDYLHVHFWPKMGVEGRNLSLYYQNQTDIPPLIHIEHFSFNLGTMGIFKVPRHIAGVRLDKMTITISPGEKGAVKMPHYSKPAVVVDQIVCDQTELLILPRKPGKAPLDFDVHNLLLTGVGLEKAFKFKGNLTNAKPKGEIATSGEFGPWDTDTPGNTRVSGEYTFSNADLGPFPGIAGILSSTGNFHGKLYGIEVQGETDTPDFSLDPVGRAVPLHTDFSATVDGLDGDTFLHPVRARLGRSLIIANGSVERDLTKEGHVIELEAVAPRARLEDILALGTKAQKPIMTGLANLKTKIVIPPGKQKVLERLRLNGDFAVDDGRFGSDDVRQKLESLSRHGLGEPKNENAGSAVSALRGHFELEKSVITFRNLMFQLEGAAVNLDGTYSIPASEMDFRGELRLHAKLSETMTGVKSVLAKPIDPFFKKKGAGTVLPITIKGPRESPTFAISVFHKTFKKTVGEKKEEK